MQNINFGDASCEPKENITKNRKILNTKIQKYTKVQKCKKFKYPSNDSSLMNQKKTPQKKNTKILNIKRKRRHHKRKIQKY